MVSGEFFEAGTSRGYPATLENQGISLLLVTNGSSLTLDPDALSISLRLAHLPRRIHFPDGSMFTTNDNDQVDSILRSLGRSPKGSMISFFETGWRWTLLALFVIPVVLYLLFSIGMPLVAQPLASMVPDTVKNELDRNVIEFLDNRLLQPSSLSLERQRKLTEKLTRFSKFAPNTRLLFRGGGLLGANALALPGGTIIFTDEIIELADYDGELVAVYLHEIGHVAGDHAMRNIIQMTGVSFIMGWLLGDLTLITDIALVGAPVFLQKMVYSRRLEREADIYAMTLMPITGYSKKCFADMMEKLSTQHGGKMDDFPDYLSSHPPTRQRVAMARSDQSCSEVRSKPGSKAPVSNQSVWTETTIATVDFEISPPEVDADPSWNNLERIMAGDRDYSPVASFGPNYPRPALTQGIQGYCVIQYTVTSLGTVRDPSVMEDQCTNSLFIAPSIEATLKFKFRPRIIDSVAVDVPGVQNKFTYQISNDLPDD